MGGQSHDGSATSASDQPLVILIPGVWWPGSLLDWGQIEEDLRALGAEVVKVEPGRLRKWTALFCPRAREGLAYYLAEQIGARLKNKPREPGPAVIAHSFGSIMLAQMLVERPPSQSLGRVVLFGAVLSPIFRWHDYLKDYSGNWSIKDLRNVVKQDRILKFWAPIASQVESLCIRCRGGKPMIGQAGVLGFMCESSNLSQRCKDHNRDYVPVQDDWPKHPSGESHNMPLNALDMPTWFYFLGVWPRFRGLQFIDEAGLAARNESVSWHPVDTIFEFLSNRETRAILVEGDKGTGKSYAAISAARKLYDQKAHDNQPIYYLDGGTVDSQSTEIILGSIKRLPLGATLLMDDLHRTKEALELALKALEVSKAHLLFVSRPLPSEYKYRLLLRACKERANHHHFLMPTGPTGRADVCGLIRAALERHLSKPPASGASIVSDAIVTEFYDCFPDNLADLFDAIAAWEPDKCITQALADEAVKARLRIDPDFRRGLRPSDQGFKPGWYEQALAAYIVVATGWQFELPTPQGVLANSFNVSFDVTSDLESRGVLRSSSPPTVGYRLDHEVRARRYVRVAASDAMLTAHLASRFSYHGLDLPTNAAGLTDYVLMLGILSADDPKEQKKFFRERIHDPLMFRGYGSELLRITATLRDHLDKLKPLAQVKVLTDGAGVRRRIGSLDEAIRWLEEAERRAREHSLLEELGNILYEYAYVYYLLYDFEMASNMFEKSAEHSGQSFWRPVGEAKAAEARFQHAMRDDHFSRNLDPTRVLDQTLTGTLEEIRQILESKRTALDGFNDEGAKRWACRLLLHLADVCLEIDDDSKAQELLKASESTVREKYPVFEPVLEYLFGRLALINQRPSEALAHLEKALEGYDAGVREPEGRGDLLIALGDTCQKRKELNKARKYYDRAKHEDDDRKNGHARAVATAVVRL